MTKNNKTIEETKCWLKKIVIENNFCPFAAKPFMENRIRYFVSESQTDKALVDDIIEELILLKNSDVKEIETSLIIVPNCLEDFDSYNQFLSIVDEIVMSLNLEGDIQVASFHPQYCFADLDVDDVRNYSNRSLYPMFHLIREESVSRAAVTYPDLHEIPERNQKQLLSMGLTSLKQQLSKCCVDELEKNT